MDEETRSRREAGWLEVIHTYFKHDLAHGHFFRTAVDNWAMYRRGGCFLNRNGGPKFFNKPRSDDERLKLMDFQSDAAWSIMNGAAIDAKLIVDHVVPVSVLHSILRKSMATGPKEIEQILVQTYRLGVLTYEEDQNPVLAKSLMPDNWQTGRDSPFARYERAGINGRIKP
jgi:hypothetical protein